MLWRVSSIHHLLNGSLPKWLKQEKTFPLFQILKDRMSPTSCPTPTSPTNALSDIYSQPSFLCLLPGQEETIQHASLPGVQ